jgi:hypothetical protein
LKFGTPEENDQGVVFVYGRKFSGLSLTSTDQKTSPGQKVYFTEKFIEQKLWGTPDIGWCVLNKIF